VYKNTSLRFSSGYYSKSSGTRIVHIPVGMRSNQLPGNSDSCRISEATTVTVTMIALSATGMTLLTSGMTLPATRMTLPATRMIASYKDDSAS
jgi:hypothetical protein